MPYVCINGASLYYEQHGSGQPVLLITGLGSNTANWLEVTKLLYKHYQVVVFDHRGSGLSSESSTQYSIDVLVADVCGLLEYLNIQQAHIIGHSLGGMVAQQFAFLYPDKVQKLVLCATANKVRFLMRQVLRFAIKIKKAQIKFKITGRQSLIFRINKSSLFKRLIAKQEHSKIDEPLYGFIQNAKIAMHFNASKWSSLLKIPILIIAGGRDPVFPLKQIKKLSNILPDSRLKLIQESGHSLHLEDPEQLSKYITEFFMQKTSQI